MDKRKKLSKFRSNPKVEEILKFIRDDKNWFYDLFDLTQKRVHHYFKLSYFENEYLESDLSLVIFGKILLNIVESDDEKFLTSLRPVRHQFVPKDKLKSEKGAQRLYMLPLDRYDNRRLVISELNQEINRYLIIAPVFIDHMKVDESIVRSEFLSLFKEKKKLESDLNSLFSEYKSLNEKSFIIPAKNKSERLKVGRKPKFSNDVFLSKYNALEPDEKNSLRSMATAIGISVNTVKKYLQECNIKSP